MNPYDIDYSKFKESKKVTNEKDLLKLRLLGRLNKIISKMETQEILDVTKLDKSDLSRVRCSDFARFSLDRIIKIFNSLGYRAEISIVSMKKVS